MDVDLLFLSRDEGPIRPDVRAGIESQRGVTVRLHRLVGERRPADVNRFETIARARNAGRSLGKAPLVMLLDDDVVLGPGCLAALGEGLRARPVFAALAADSDGEMRRGLDHWDYPSHVGMAAVMFRREPLSRLVFRWEPRKCECLCCAEDLRRNGLAIGYHPAAVAWHRPARRPASQPSRPEAVLSDEPKVAPPSPPPAADGRALPGRILVTFNRPHYRLFLRRFLGTLRRTGNRETVTAVASGLRPSEARRLAAEPGVELVEVPDVGHPSLRKVHDFPRLLDRWAPETPVAFWDAGDVVFQARVAPLWDLVRANPGRYLTSTEGTPFRDNPVTFRWADTIRDEAVRRRALDLLLASPVINSGFGAGPADALGRALKGASDLLRSGTLDGSTERTEQTALNIYLHSRPDEWVEIEDGWNFCFLGCRPDEYRIRDDGWTERFDGKPLHVVHGVGGSLKPWDLVHLTT